MQTQVSFTDGHRRTTGLKRVGVDPNRYREREPGPLTVRIQTSEGTNN